MVLKFLFPLLVLISCSKEPCKNNQGLYECSNGDYATDCKDKGGIVSTGCSTKTTDK